MFKKEYQVCVWWLVAAADLVVSVCLQGGSSVELFSAQGRDPVQHWRLTGSVKKYFDKDIRGYVYVLEGGSSTTTTRMTLPKSEKSSCEC